MSGKDAGFEHSVDRIRLHHPSTAVQVNSTKQISAAKLRAVAGSRIAAAIAAIRNLGVIGQRCHGRLVAVERGKQDVNPRSIFLGGELAEVAIPGKTEPVLRVVVGIEERCANIDFATLLDAIVSGFAEIGSIRRDRVVGTTGLSGGKKDRNCECDANHHDQCDEWTFHEGPPGKNGQWTRLPRPKVITKESQPPRTQRCTEEIAAQIGRESATICGRI